MILIGGNAEDINNYIQAVVRQAEQVVVNSFYKNSMVCLSAMSYQHSVHMLREQFRGAKRSVYWEAYMFYLNLEWADRGYYSRTIKIGHRITRLIILFGEGGTALISIYKLTRIINASNANFDAFFWFMETQVEGGDENVRLIMESRMN